MRDMVPFRKSGHRLYDEKGVANFGPLVGVV